MDLNRDEAKLNKVREEMRQRNLDALVLRIPENVSYLSGAWCGRGLSYLVFHLEKDPILVHPTGETLPPTWVKDVRFYKPENFEHMGNTLEIGTNTVIKAVSDLGLTGGSIGVEQSWELVLGGPLRYEVNVVGEKTISVLKNKLLGFNLKDSSELLVKCRSLKTEQEVEALKLASRIAHVGLGIFLQNLKPGLSEIELSSKIEYEIVTTGVMKYRAHRVNACAFVVSGPATAQGYKYVVGNGRRKLKRGDLVLLELDVIVDGYSSDTTRTFVVGKPNREQRKLLEAVHDSEQSAISAIEPEVSAAEVARTSIEAIKKHELSGYLVHRLGHGIGVAIHEPIPALHIESKDILQPGMVHSVEPGIYGTRIGGIRIEDDILNTTKGPEYLTHFTRLQE